MHLYLRVGCLVELTPGQLLGVLRMPGLTSLISIEGLPLRHWIRLVNRRYQRGLRFLVGFQR